MAQLILHDIELAKAITAYIKSEYGVVSWNGITISTEVKAGATNKTYCVIVSEVVFGAQKSDSNVSSSFSDGAKKDDGMKKPETDAQVQASKLDLD